MELPLPCIVCGKRLENVSLVDQTVNQPYAGTAFTTKGHYGSTVFDPMDSFTWLEITVCDDCMMKKAEEGVIGTYEQGLPRNPPPTAMSQWEVRK